MADPDPRTPVLSRAGADVEVDALTWRPLRRREPVLADLTLQVPAGQRVLLVGPSGAGKSTLLRAIAGVLETADAGDLSGGVRIDGARPGSRGAPALGLLQQDPTAGIVAETVGRDVAFGLENLRVPPAQIWERVRAALSAVGFGYDLDRPTGALSGGEVQRLALAGTLALDARVLLLDEPTSMLDPQAAATVVAAVQATAEARAATMIVAAHHLQPWLGFADRMLVLDAGGALVADGRPVDVLSRHGADLAASGVWVPGLAAPALHPLGPELVAPEPPNSPDSPDFPDSPGSTLSGPLVRAEGVAVRLAGPRGRHTLALDGVDASVSAGRALAATGASGAGKSTLVSVLAGLQRPSAGTVRAAPELATRRGREPWRWRSRDLAGRIAWVPQLPEHGVVARTVRDEVMASGRACGRPQRRLADRAEALLGALGLAHLSGASPYHLSGGEQRRLMLAAALAHGPSVLALDEPTVGQDRLTWAAVLGAVAGARDAGAAVALATHDELAVDTVADDVIRLGSGKVIA